MNEKNWNRREVVAAGIAAGVLPNIAMTKENTKMISKPIPASGESLPVIGLGTYEVFDVESTPDALQVRREILELLTASGGSLIDTSPMYNRSEKVIGDIIESGAAREPLFLATKVWTDGQETGARQMQRSADLMQTDVIDLMQVHNLRDTAVHMETMREWQEAGKIRYSGLTHYTASAHEALGREMAQFKPDFIQINYSLGEREAEDRLLPMAQDQGVAVLINRPFQAGRLFAAVSGTALPDWAQDFAASWGQFFLKFIISHPAVTCVIPATSKVHHMVDNLATGQGILPDPAMRKRMSDFFASL
ncbi:MAG: aldo/keto reductase [Gammaproteobacteria bacterium]|nr:aldo/keto reductase [Gammaproteobacteria bacterium]MDH5584108.1 aldo/keto reductase [Gammaproteobacteria bacterium]